MIDNVAVADLSASAPTVVMSLIDLLMLNAVVCGLEFCASAAFCYIPPLLLKAGIRYTHIHPFIMSCSHKKLQLHMQTKKYTKKLSKT